MCILHVYVQIGTDKDEEDDDDDDDGRDDDDSDDHNVEKKIKMKHTTKRSANVRETVKEEEKK